MSDAVADFVEKLRCARAGATSDVELVHHVAPHLAALARTADWMRPDHYGCDTSQGFGVHVLHEEPGDGPWVVVVAWLPHRGAAPHNHGTWAVVAGVDGVEENVLWTRRGGVLRRAAAQTLGPGQVTTFLGNAVHSVFNASDRTTLSLHVYGRNLNAVERSLFDPETGEEKPFKLNLQPRSPR